jgi:hypothetical protein
MPTRRLRFFLLLVFAACAGSASEQFWLIPRGAAFPSAWVPQFSILVGISLVL